MCDLKQCYETYTRAKQRARRLRNTKDVKVFPYRSKECRCFLVGGKHTTR